MRSEGYAVGTVFALNGTLFGSWVVRVPDAADRTHSSAGILGLTLLCIAGGAIVAMPAAGRLFARVDSRYVVIVAGTLNCLALGFLAGPPAIGMIAQWASLRAGLSLVGMAAAAGLLLAVANRRLLHEVDPSSASSAKP